MVISFFQFCPFSKLLDSPMMYARELLEMELVIQRKFQYQTDRQTFFIIRTYQWTSNALQRFDLVP